MRRSRADGGEGTSRQNGSGGRERSEQQQQSDAEPEEFCFNPTDSEDSESDPRKRRELRSRYRDLINALQQNREDMLSPSNNKLTEVLEEANQLFKEVRQVREAALDTQLLVVATDLGKEKVTQICAGNGFDLSVCAQHLLSYMGLNRLEEDEDGQEGNGYMPQDAWHRLAARAEACFKTTPSFHYMNGSFHVEPPPPKPRAERQRRAPAKEVKRIMPTQLKKLENSHQEATEKEVERILAYLRGYYREDPTPISYYEFVIDPTSFPRTIENIFHTSFLIRDGLARMYLDDDKLPCIAPLEDEMEDSHSFRDSSSRKQCIVSFSPKLWKELIDALEIRNAMIHPPDTQIS